MAQAAYPLIMEAGTIVSQIPTPFAAIQRMKPMKETVIVHLCEIHRIMIEGTKIQERTSVT